jgi:drug/metabolite transporter (DMT)-like permease
LKSGADNQDDPARGMSMLKGELAAFAVALCWTVSAVSFENASKRIGSFSVNILRLILAYIFLTVYNAVFYGNILPYADMERFLWLSLSGFVGFFIGDLFLFQAFVLIGSRVSMLIMCTSPIMASIAGFFIFGENPSPADTAAIIIVLTGIALVVLIRDSSGDIKFTQPLPGILCAFAGAAGQAGGLVLSKIGVTEFDPFIATQIRIIAGLGGFLIAVLVMRNAGRVVLSFMDIKSFSFTTLGAFFGPFLGVSLSLYSVKYSDIGIASTLMSVVPVLLIPVSFFLYGERVRKMEIAGIIISMAGVSMLFLL